MKKVFLTGRKGVGKSTILREFVKTYPTRVGGFLTQPVYEGPQVVGYELCTFDGRRRLFASIEPLGPVKQGRYVVDADVFDTLGVDALQRALREAELIIMDELGKMEAKAERFRRAVEECLAGDKPVLGVVQKGSCFIEAILQHGIPIWEVKPESHQRILTALWELFRVRSNAFRRF